LALLAFIAFLGAMAMVAADRASLSSSSTDLLDERFVELLVKEPEPEEHREKDRPAANPDAGEGAKAKKEEGKVGKKDAKMEKAKGNKVEIDQQELDREMADNAGLMGQMADQGGMDGILGDTIVDENMMGGIGGALGAKGYQMGAGGLGSRGSGLGGGGSASGLGGTGTRGRGGGSSGFGSGQGNFGPKGEGGIGRIGGDPIILGALDKSLIDRVIKRNMNQIKYCYQRQLNANPTLNGKIVVKFVISGDGSVSQAKTHSSTMTGGGAVQSCINERFLRFQFPEPRGGGIVIVKYPFLFSPQ
ncbi:MAG: AgmX/PglI C-terminal domain-containing protein, partial [Myxococcota bacterium]|nr:AgmX/PglI C-terminal domain-containing protein [Myxococcota bacterium]